jgi:hypothetical protein
VFIGVLGFRGLEDRHFGVLRASLRPCEARRVQKPQMTTDELSEHLQLLEVASREDLDELLTDLLCHVYRSKDAQNG